MEAFVSVTAALIVMPLLAKAKRKVARDIGSRALVADSKQTDICLLVRDLAGRTGAECIIRLVVGGSRCRTDYGAYHRERGIGITVGRNLLRLQHLIQRKEAFH